jgi:aspartyl-tRNA synthetase
LTKTSAALKRHARFSPQFSAQQSQFIMHAYRTHHCADLRAGNVGETVRLSGWIHRKRDHGHLLFVDLRDHYGIVQVVADTDSAAFKTLDRVRLE